MCQTNTVDDRALLNAFIDDRNQSAFAQIVERHARWVFAAAFRQLRDRHLAEDAVQIVFVILAQKAQTMNGRQKLSGWLFNTLQFTVKNLGRAERSRRRYEANAAKPAMQEPLPDSTMVRECAEQIDTAVARLPKAYRQAILLRFYQDLPFDQIALELGTKEGAARKRVDRALERLRKHLGATAPTGSMLSAATAYGLDQLPPSLIPRASKAALADNAAGALTSVVSVGAKQVAHLIAITKLQVAGLVVCACLLIGVPAALVIRNASIPGTGSAQPSVNTQAMSASPSVELPGR